MTVARYDNGMSGVAKKNQRKLFSLRQRKRMRPCSSADKGDNCKASAAERIMAKRSRSYRTDNYEAYCKAIDVKARRKDGQ